MPTLLDKIRTEPAMLAATILAVVAFLGVRLSEDQASAVSQLVTVLGPLIAGLFVRSQVTPVAKTGGQVVDRVADHGENPELIDDGETR